MAFYSFEMILVGIILLTAMAVGGIKIWLGRKQGNLDQIKANEDAEQTNQDSL